MDDQPSTPTTNPAPPTQPTSLGPQSPPPQATVTAEISGVPGSWPGAFGVYKFSKAAVKKNLGPIIIFYLASIVFGNIFSLFIDNAVVNQIISLVVSALFTAALIFVEISGVRRLRVEIAEGLRVGLRYTLKTVGLLILEGLLLGISLLLLIIPFIIVLPRILLAGYFLVDKNLGIIAAFKASWKATKGHSGKVWGIIGVMILMALLFITIIGIPVAIYLLLMYSAAFAVLYEYINKTQPAEAPTANTPPPIQPPNPPVVQ